MMSVITYLQSQATAAVLSDDETNSIATSVSTLAGRLDSYFTKSGDGLAEKFRFGSSTRGTILPRKIDANSDIDYMIVFENSGYTPQTYLNRLKVFVEKRYSSSEIYQSSPTIVLELDHIKFDLVPALHLYGSTYNIPNGNNSWSQTNPNDFNIKIEQANKNNLSLLKPTIRLAKAWNAANGYVFESYGFEKWISERTFTYCRNQRDYLFAVFDCLSVSCSTQWRNDKIHRAKAIVSNVRRFEQSLMTYAAEQEIKKLIPQK